MVKNLLLLVSTLFFLISCGQQTHEGNKISDDMIRKAEVLESSLPQAERDFLKNMADLCGNSFRGKETFSAPGRESWRDKDFLIHITVCDEDKVHIPFHIDQDRSRTWMFLAEENGLRFRHDHRHEDGTPEDLTMYGGYADGTGTGFIQRFPADKYTRDLLNDTIGREWRVVLAEDMSTLTYELHYSGRLMFAAGFDLTSPIED